MSLVCSSIGVTPLFLRKRFVVGGIVGIASLFILWLVFYGSTPSMVWPFFGLPGLAVFFLWLSCFIVELFLKIEGTNEKDRQFRGLVITGPLVGAFVVCLAVRGIYGWSAFNATHYSSMLGSVDVRDWNQDVQPKDPRHMRMVSEENAHYIAKKAVANAGTIGSQFALDDTSMTLQKVNGHLVYVIPFDFSQFSVWLNSAGSPGYIIVDAEDPEIAPRLVELEDGELMQYMPGAFFAHNLERHLRKNGYSMIGLIEPRFELDEEGRAYWVVSTYQPTVSWWGEKVTGVLTIDPGTGTITQYTVENAPVWIDRIVPRTFTMQYITWRGEYSGGWLNSWWGKKDLTQPETSTLIYGSDNRAEWVSGITSTSAADDSLVGLMYTDSRTGKTVYYRTNGGATDEAVVQAVNNNMQVKFKHLHASTPQLYNVYGTMASVVPLLNENHAFQGMAIALITNVQDVAVGTNQAEALRNYQTIISRHGQKVALEKTHEVKTLEGVVDRIRQDVSQNGTTYFFHLEGIPSIFSTSSTEHVKISLTEPGDKITITYVASGEEVVPVQEFDNLSLPLNKTPNTLEIEQAAAAKHDAEVGRVTAKDLISKLKEMTPDEVERLRILMEKK